MSLVAQDNRIRFDPTEIDFVNDVGLTGLAHDNFPAPGQARYDWMRIYLIGLLANQSGTVEPVEKRVGTLWYKVGYGFKIWVDRWDDLAEHIGLLQSDGSLQTLQAWFDEISPKVDAIQYKFTYSGSVVGDNVIEISIPVSIRPFIAGVTSLRPMVYKNGILLDLRHSSFDSINPVKVVLSGGEELNSGDKFIVTIENFDYFVVDELVVS